MLAVWGSPSSGKTIMSVKLARYIASQKKNVILVLADMSAPPFPLSSFRPILKSKHRSETSSAQLTSMKILLWRSTILYKQNYICKFQSHEILSKLWMAF